MLPWTVEEGESERSLEKETDCEHFAEGAEELAVRGQQQPL
jgi:hypothetical protein